MKIKNAYAHLTEKPKKGANPPWECFELWLELPQLQAIFGQARFQVQSIGQIRIDINGGTIAKVEDASVESIVDIFRNPPRHAPKDETIRVTGDIIAYFECDDDDRPNGRCTFHIDAQEVFINLSC